MNTGASSKVPPAWSPERDKFYPLRIWVQDLRLWSRATDIDEDKKGPCAAQRVGGSARELVRELDVDILANGMLLANAQGIPVQTSGLECLIRAISRRYAPLEQELEIHCISEILMFKRAPGEDTDGVVSRFEIVRERALAGAGFDMSWIGFSFLLLTVLGISKAQWPLLLAPTQSALPRTQQEYQAFINYIRRQGHLYDRGVDVVKNMNFFQQEVENSETRSYHAYPMFAEHQHEQQSWQSDPFGSSYYDPNYSYLANDSDADQLSSCASGTSEPDLSDMHGRSLNEVGEQLYLAHRHHKRRWRKFIGRRRSFKGTRKGKGWRSGGKFGGKGFGKFGKGKGKKGKTMFYVDEYGNTYTDEDGNHEALYFGETVSEWYEDQDEQVVFMGNGKFKRKNPKGKDGKTLECSLCGSDDHLIAKCPRNKTGMTHSQALAQKPKTFLAQPSNASASSGSHQAPSVVEQSWGSVIYAGHAHEVQVNSLSYLEMSDGTVIELDAADVQANISEEVDDSPQRPLYTNLHPLMPSSTVREFSIPKSLSKESSLSRSGESSQISRHFAFAWWMPPAFHAQVRLASGIEALLIDVGAGDNLVGEEWVTRATAQAKAAGQGCAWQKLKKTLSVEGVGQKSNEAVDEVIIAICLADGNVGTFKAPVIPDSPLPALLGLRTLTKMRAVIDCFHRRIVFVGEGGYKMQLSPGSVSYKLESAVTGHLLLPCQCWSKAKLQPGKEIKL